MIKLRKFYWLLTLALVPIGACDDTEDDETMIETSGTGEESDEDLENMAWSDVPPDQRGAWMQLKVVPEMKTLFQGYDSTKFANFGCQTCHGANGGEIGFKMPATKALPQNDPGSPNPDFAGFMSSEVTPRMVQILGAQPYDSATGQGFGCFGCHQTQ